jgi:hypothetical protein
LGQFDIKNGTTSFSRLKFGRSDRSGNGFADFQPRMTPSSITMSSLAFPMLYRSLTKAKIKVNRLNRITPPRITDFHRGYNRIDLTGERQSRCPSQWKREDILGERHAGGRRRRPVHAIQAAFHCVANFFRGRSTCQSLPKWDDDSFAMLGGEPLPSLAEEFLIARRQEEEFRRQLERFHSISKRVYG